MTMPGSKAYEVEYLESVVEEDIFLLPKRIKTAIKKAIEERLMIDPISFGKPLRYSLRGHRRLRVGDYRVVYRIDPDTKLVVIVAIKHGKEVYEE